MFATNLLLKDRLLTIGEIAWCLLLYYGMKFLSLDTIDVAIQPSMQNIIAVQGGIIVLK